MEDSRELILLGRLSKVASELELYLPPVEEALRRVAPETAQDFMVSMRGMVEELGDIRHEISDLILK